MLEVLVSSPRNTHEILPHLENLSLSTNNAVPADILADVIDSRLWPESTSGSPTISRLRAVTVANYGEISGLTQFAKTRLDTFVAAGVLKYERFSSAEEILIA
jgi:hypothetical protein